MHKHSFQFLLLPSKNQGKLTLAAQLGRNLFLIQIFFLLDTVSMGTHSLSGTRDYSNVLCRRDYMYIYHFRSCGAI